MDSPLDLPNPAPSFEDRKTGLVVFGIFTILIGLFFALMVPVMAWAQSMAAQAGTPQDAKVMLPALLMYAVMAVVLVWLGIGSILARRWARALLLIFAWTWLLVGVSEIGVMAFVLPKIFASASSVGNLPAQQTPPQPAPEPPSTVTGTGTDKDPTTYNFHASAAPAAGVQSAVMVVTMIMMTVMFIVLPLAWLLFYQSRHVKATCEARDPVVRWTDRCPLPVIALCLWFAVCSPMMLIMAGAYHGVVPAFGTFLVGPAGATIYVLLGILWGYAAWAMYRLESRGWWIVFISMVIFPISAFLTYTRHDLSELYTLMGYRQEMINQIQAMGFLNGQTMAWMTILVALPILGYLLWVRRYFRADAREG